MSIKETRDARLPLARKHFKERCEVFGANHLARQCAVKQVQLARIGMISTRLKGDDRASCPCAIDEIQRGTKQAGEGLRQRYPLGKRTVWFAALIHTQSQKLSKIGLHSLFFRFGLDPCPQLNTRCAFFIPFPRSCTPTLSIPSTGREANVKLLCLRML